MATIVDNGMPTLVNVMRRLAPDGSVETNIAEMLSKKNPILDDIPWQEGNLPTGHKITSRTGLPVPSWRRFNEGVSPTKSDGTQYDEACGMLEDLADVDVALAKLNGNAAAWRASENVAHVEGISQEFARAVFYESATVAPEKIHGLSPRYFASTGYTASSYVLPKGTLSGTNCQSIWLITWELRKVYGIYPKASAAGLTQKDHGEIWVRDSSSKDLLVYRTHYKWDCGIAVEDYRYAVRAQWDPDDTALFEDVDKGILTTMQDMLDTIYEVTPNTRFYVSRATKKKLNAQLQNATVNLTENIQSQRGPLMSFQGVPIRVVECLVPESAIA